MVKIADIEVVVVLVLLKKHLEFWSDHGQKTLHQFFTIYCN